MKFLVVNHLPPALCRFLASHGHAAIHVQEVNLAEASDSAICDHATSQKMHLISKDDDFLYFANRTLADITFVWVRFPNCRKAALLGAFEQALPMLIAAIDAGERIVELR